MPYSKNKAEVHSLLAGIYARYKDKGFIHFHHAPEVRGTRYLEDMIRAIEEKKVLRLTYLPYYEDKPYYNDIHPYLLKEHGFRWYLVAWNAFKGQLRTYALDRIRNVEVLEGQAYREAEFDSAEYFKYSMGIIAPSGVPPLIKLAVQLTQAQYLITQPWHPSQNIEEENQEEVVFSFRLHPTYEFKSQVLSLGKDARVLEPASLKKDMLQELDSMVSRYR